MRRHDRIGYLLCSESATLKARFSDCFRRWAEPILDTALISYRGNSAEVTAHTQ
jgi:hypothetical protein